jgi:hypothetical protein
VAYSIQDRFARYLLVERRYINTKEAVLITLVVVAEIDLVPDGIVKLPDKQIDQMIRRPGRIEGAPSSLSRFVKKGGAD